MALLAKKCWRVFKNPKSLVARVLEGCYFPNCSLLEAPKKSSASFVWSSLFWGKELLVSGLRWRVGNGRSIKIYQDKWVPKPAGFMVLSQPTLVLTASVDQLISSSGGWNSSLIHSLFSVEDARAILQIPLGSLLASDVLIWHYKLSGCFTVKSGYRVEKEAESLPSSSNNDRLQGWWNTLWKLKIPLKVKFFIWKSCFDWIPAMSNLVRHGMQVVDVCHVCFSAGESTIHTLWGCSKLRCARKDWLPSDVKVRSLYANFFDLILDCHSLLSLEDLGLFCTIVWRVWYLRNLVVHDSPSQDVLEASHWCRLMLNDFLSSENVLIPPHSSLSQVHNPWRPPDLDVYKINCDVAINTIGGRVGLGIVIRNCSGAVMASCSIQLEACFDPILAEMMAIYRGLIFSRECGLHPCVLESNVAVVVKWVNDHSHSDSVGGNILGEISSLITNLQILAVSHVPILANFVAHGLARFALTVDEDRYWMEDFPSCVRRAVQFDYPIVRST